MKVFIVMRQIYDEVDEHTYVVDMFIDEKVAQDFVDEVTLKSMYLREEIKKIWKKYREEAVSCRRLLHHRKNKEKYERNLDKLLEITIERTRQERVAIEKAGLGDLFLNGDNDTLSVDEYEVNMKRR